MRYIDMYKHINEKSKVEVDIEDIAKQVINMNYGVHRLLSALVIYAKGNKKFYGDRQCILAEVEKLLEEGFF